MTKCDYLVAFECPEGDSSYIHEIVDGTTVQAEGTCRRYTMQEFKVNVKNGDLLPLVCLSEIFVFLYSKYFFNLHTV